MSKSCKTCIFSRWWLTDKGNIKKHSGSCVVKFVEPTLPACIVRPNYHRIAVWPDNGGDCPLWEKNEGKPISETSQ